MQIRELTKQDHELVLTLARELASWFNPLDQMALAIDLLRHEGFVAMEGQDMAGFVTFHFPTPLNVPLNCSLGMRQTSL